MKVNWPGALAVAGLVLGIVVYKQVSEPDVGPGAAVTSGAEAPRVQVPALAESVTSIKLAARKPR